MENHTIIADISNIIMKNLVDNLVPKIIGNPESIGVCSPDNRGDCLLGIWNYDIRKSESYHSHNMININEKIQKYPSQYLDLYYMITPYSNSDVKYMALEEQNMLGKVMQIIHDNPYIDTKKHITADIENDNTVSIEMISMSFEDKIKVWNFPNKAYKTSLFYKISNVELESSRTKEVHRVVDVKFEFEKQD